VSRTVALSVLIADVRFKADAGGASVRHTDVQITRLINQSIQMFRERISDDGSQHYLVPYSGTLGIGPTSPFAFYQLDLSSGPSPSLVRTYGLDVTIDGQVCKLEHVPFESRNDYGTVPGGSRPIAWFHIRTDQVGIVPASSGAYPFTVWYLPKFTDLAAAGDTFEGVAGWEEWVVWDVVCQVIARDQFPQAFEIAERRRAEVEQRVIRGATKVTQAGGAHVGRDSFGGKLPHFLGGRTQARAVAGGPYVPAGGSVTNAMLADMTGPTVKAVMSGTTRPQDVQVATLTTYLGLFNTSQRGLVPPPVSVGGLFLKDDGTWASAAGAGAAAGPSGAIQFQGGAGAFGTASGFSIIGSQPSLIARLDGSLRVTGGQVEVGSGTVKVSASGVDVGNGSIVNVATLVATDASFRSVRVSSGIADSQLAAMGSGTVKGSLTGTGTPADISIATLHAFAPTFTATKPGTVPGSGGGTANYLRADGTWATPPGGSGSSPGGSVGEVQYNDGVGGFAGASGVRIVGSGLDVGLGASYASQGNVRGGADFALFGMAQSGFDVRLLSLAAETGTVSMGNTSQVGGVSKWLHQVLPDDASDPNAGFAWRFGGATATTAKLMQTGLDLTGFHLSARSLKLATGITSAQMSPMGSGTVKGNLSGTGTPSDVAIATLHAFAPSFTASQPGIVPGSGGGTTNFLRADGTWATPPSAAGSAAGDTGNVQYRDEVGGFAAAPNLNLRASGSVLWFGYPSGPIAASATVQTNQRFNFIGAQRYTPGTNATLVAQFDKIIDYTPTGANGNASILHGNGSGMINLLRMQTAPSGSVSFVLGASGTSELRFLGDTGAVDFRKFHLTTKSLNVTDKIANSELAVMATGTFKGSLGGGEPADVSVNTLLAFAPTFTATTQGVVPPSGGGTTNFLSAAGTWIAPSGAHQFPPVAGATNAQLAVMSTGTVKANLSGNATPSDVPVNTLLAFAPTFTATIRGVVPPSGGGTTNFLRADGTWTTPAGAPATPGGGPNSIQFNDNGTTNGASGFGFSSAGGALGVGVPSFLPGFGDVRVASGFNITANLPSGVAGVAANQNLFDWTGGGGSGVLKVGGASGVMGTVRSEVATGGSFEWLVGGQTGVSLKATGLDARAQHISAKSISIGHINGLPFDFNGLKRGIDIGNSSGLPSGLSLYLPRGAGSGANRYIIPSGTVGTGTQAAPRFLTLNPTGGRGGGVIRIEKVNDGGWPYEIRTPTGTVLHSFPSGAKGWADFMFEKPSGAVFQLAGHADMY